MIIVTILRFCPSNFNIMKNYFNINNKTNERSGLSSFSHFSLVLYLSKL